MGYTTEFQSAIVVRPQLPNEFVSRWNEAKQGTPGKAYVASSRWDEDGQWVLDEPDMLPGVVHAAKPQAWCRWELAQWTMIETLEPVTLISWDGWEKFYDYEEWLQVLVDVIEREHGAHEYDGAMDWSGEDPDDAGRLFVERTDNQAQVVREYRSPWFDPPGWLR